MHCLKYEAPRSRKQFHFAASSNVHLQAAVHRSCMLQNDPSHQSSLAQRLTQSKIIALISLILFFLIIITHALIQGAQR